MNITKDTKYCIYWKNREGILQSWSRDIVTFGFLLLCIYVSHGSAWWTFFTGAIFLIFGSAKIAKQFKQDRHDFTTKDEVKRWLDSLD